MRSLRARSLWLPLLLLLACACGESEKRAGHAGVPTGPNVLVIVMDTARADRCGFNGYARPTTPSLDALAEDGVVFRNTWSPSSWTGPSHASLFTGLRPARHGLMMGNRMYLAKDHRTLAEIMLDAGYRTACLSNNHIVSPEWGLTQGFEMYTPYFTMAPRTQSLSLRTHQDAMKWVRDVRRSGEKFFMFINDMEPHLPYTPPGPFQRRFVPADIDRVLVNEIRRFESPRHLQYCLRQINLGRTNLDLLGRLYDAEIATLDASIGWLVEEFERAGILDETLVVITSDHGEALGEHHMIGHNLSLDPWLLHVPLLVRFPGTFDGGRIVDDLVRLEDVMPTCLELCGLEVPDGLDARTLTGNLTGRLARAVLGPPIGAETNEIVRRSGKMRFLCSLRSIQDGRYHFIRYSDGREELFDLTEDPQALVNLRDDRPEVLRRLRALLREDRGAR